MSVWGIWKAETLWGWRTGADTPELLLAWDGFDVDENYDGWKDACAKSLAENDIAPELSRRITFRVPGDAVMDAFDPPEIDVEVTPQSTS